MRVVIFSHHDMEAITVVEVPQDIINSLRHGDYIRLMPRLKFDFSEWRDCESAMTLQFKYITVRMWKVFFRNINGSESTWVGTADDDALEANSVLLPGQQYIVENFRRTESR